MNLEEIKNIIYTSNFNNNKAKNIKLISNIIIHQYDGNMPNTY